MRRYRRQEPRKREPGPHSTNKEMEEFRRQIKKDSIRKAYQALISYMMGLRTHFNSHFAGSSVSGLYQGYLDITFLALFPPSLKRHSLKVAVVFNYDAFRFEAWLAGRNRKVQRHYWELLKEGEWPGCRVTSPGKGVDSILVCDLASEFDLGNPAALTSVIESGTVEFINAVEEFLSGHRPLSI